MTVLAGLLCVLIVSSRFLHHAEAGDWGSILPAVFHNTTFPSTNASEIRKNCMACGSVLLLRIYNINSDSGL
jgi:hypothetical protein